MKLETITINGTEYFQFVKIGGAEDNFINTVGDIFSLNADINYERAKFKEAIEFWKMKTIKF